ncbi:MAG: ribbon-helix-helix protein, CopG family [Rubrobacter sp.]|nr:ribbon-helix-helix protein, CopG family [Rubrobacter sp.]
MDRKLLEAVRKIAAEEGRGESEVIEEALRRYIASEARSGESFGEIFARVEEWQRRRGVEPLSEHSRVRAHLAKRSFGERGGNASVHRSRVGPSRESEDCRDRA